MSVNWSWKHKIGEIKTTNGCKYNIYHANCLGAIIYDFKDTITGEDMYQFITFWNDKEHLRRCLGLKSSGKYGKSNDYNGVWKSIKLNAYYSEAIDIAKLFSQALKLMPGFKIEIYYKAPKNRK